MIGAGFKHGRAARVQNRAGCEVNQYQHERGERAVTATRRLAFCTDFRSHQQEEFRDQNPCDQSSKKPGIDRGQPVFGEARVAERPEEG